MRAAGRLFLALAILSLAACGGGRERYEARGRVVSVNAAERILKVAHEEIPGFMPAMTMNFDVASSASMAGLEAGDEIRFEIERAPDHLRVVRIERLGDGAAFAVEESARDQEPLAPRPAPPIRLTDQAGRPFDLGSLRGRAVLLDFIFTTCAGPCPILTGAHVRLQRRLPADLRDRVSFVSVTVDPAHDTPEKLAAYARAQGADLGSWHFLTGKVERVQKVLEAYHVGSVGLPDGALNHTVVTYLIGPGGKIRRHYLGLEHSQEEVLADLAEVLS